MDRDGLLGADRESPTHTAPKLVSLKRSHRELWSAGGPPSAVRLERKIVNVRLSRSICMLN